MFFIGANDIGRIVDRHYDPAALDSFRSSARDELETMIATLVTSVRAARDAGAEAVFLGTLPSASFFPLFDDYDATLVDAFDDVVTAFNAALRLAAATLRAQGHDVAIVDYNTICNVMTDDPSSFGVVAVRQNYLYDGSLATGADQVAFWNALHPAEAYHKAWAAFTAFTLDGGRTHQLTNGGDSFTDPDEGSAALVAGLAGDDVIRLGDGADIGFGGRGADRIQTEDGNDIAVGGRGADLLRGQAGDDILSGGQGDDILTGGRGRDVLIDGLGNDTLRGGADDDVFVYVQASLIGGAGIQAEHFLGGTGQDTLFLVLDSARAAAFEAGTLELADLGITTNSIDTVIAIDGQNEETTRKALAGEWWYGAADHWGLV